jgi:hypothetical protein
MVSVVLGGYILVALSFIGAAPAKGETPTYQFACKFYQKKGGDTKLIAQPNLITLQGRSAAFLAGGQVPVPDLTANGKIGFVPTGVESTMHVSGSKGDRVILCVSLSQIRSVNVEPNGFRTRTNTTQLQQAVKLGEEVELVLDEEKDAGVTTTLKLTVTKAD